MPTTPSTFHRDRALRAIDEFEADMKKRAEKLMQDICVLSRHNVCLYDLREVAETAKKLGLNALYETAVREKDNSTGGSYYLAIKSLYGVAS
jgi:hypothetical protein